MKTLYLECGMGAAGDMMMAALLELVPDREAFVEKMNSLRLPGVRVQAEKSVKCGITGTHMKIEIGGEEEISEDVPGWEHDHHAFGHDHEHSGEHGHGEEHFHDHEHPHSHEEHHDHEHGISHSHEEHHDHDHFHEGSEEGHGMHGEPHHGEHAHEHGHHHHTTMADINRIVDGLEISEQVRADVKAVYSLIAEAESRVHGHPVQEIHFHEVGSMDAVVDVTGVCILMEMIGAEKIVASPVHVGSGYVRCAHGVLPVPAPATALILQGVPTYGGQIQGELCTPTGAALLKHFVSSFGDRPVMAVSAIGYGMGKKDFERANCVRAFLGESDGELERIVKLECNLDDMSGEAIGFAMNQLFKAGAYDVYTQGIGMKKSRPGVLLSVICGSDQADRLAALMMKHTTTLGIRRQNMDRYALQRHVETVETVYGPVRVKESAGMGVCRRKAEYDDLAALAEAHGVSLEEVRAAVK